MQNVRRERPSSRDFAFLWAGQTLSSFGNEVTRLALPVLAITALGATAADVGILRALAFLPFLALGLPAGVWLSGMDRRMLLIVNDLGRAILLLGLAILVALGFATVPLLWLVAFAIGAFAVFFEIAYAAYPPTLVPPNRLIAANARLEGSASAARMFGPAIGGLLVSTVGAVGALVLDTLTYVASVGTVAAIRAREVKPGRLARSSWRHEIAHGLRFVRSDAVLWPLLVCAAVYAVFDTATWTVLPVVVLRDMGESVVELGLIFGPAGLGLLGGNVIAGRSSDRFRASRLLRVGAATAVAGHLVLGTGATAGSMPVLVAGALVSGLGEGSFAIPYITLRQIAPAHLLTRVVATFRASVWGAFPVGGLFVGFAGVTLSPTWVLVASVAATALCLVPLRARGLEAAEHRLRGNGG